jgi:hypothetical protein
MACAREQGPSNGKSGQVFSFFLFFTPNQVKFFPFSFFFLTPNQVKFFPFSFFFDAKSGQVRSTDAAKKDHSSKQTQ